MPFAVSKTACQVWLGVQGHCTFAISPQLLPASRIVFNLCSSLAVHGVLVLPFFLPASTGVAGTGADVSGAAGIGAALLSSTGAGGLEGEPVGLDPALLEARRFLGLAGGGGKVEKVVPVAAGWDGAAASTGAIGPAEVVGEAGDADTFWRFCGGGDLSRPLVWAAFPLAAAQIEQN
jgi:hypothetical protein